MTVSNQTVFVVHRGNGAAKIFPYNFRLTELAMVRVSLRDYVSKEELRVLLPSEYSITGVARNNYTGGSVTYPLTSDPAIPTTQELVIERVVDFRQDLVLLNEGGFYPEAVEYQLDLLEFQIQQLANWFGRSILVPIGVDIPSWRSFPNSNLLYVNGANEVVQSETPINEKSLRIEADNALLDEIKLKSDKTIRVTVQGDWLEGGGTLEANFDVDVTPRAIAALKAAETAIQEENLKGLAFKDKITVSDIETSGSNSPAAVLTQAGVWVVIPGGGDMLSVFYDPHGLAKDVYLMSSMQETEHDLILKPAERTAIASAVRYSEVQTLTPAEQAQARLNILAASQADLIAFSEAAELALSEKLDKNGTAANSEKLGGKTEYGMSIEGPIADRISQVEAGNASVTSAQFPVGTLALLCLEIGRPSVENGSTTAGGNLRTLVLRVENRTNILGSISRGARQAGTWMNVSGVRMDHADSPLSQEWVGYWVRIL